jgi:AcrR family transcriptional regulator
VATEQAVNAPSGRGTRRHILAAAEQIIHDQGLKAATTRAIAQRAGCAEGTIYRYFSDKHALVMEVIGARFPEFKELMHSLDRIAGTSTVKRNLERVVRSALEFYRAIMPIVAGSLAEHKLMHEQRRYFQENERGPMSAFGHLADYIRLEQRLDRISGRASPDFSTRILLGAAWTQAFLEEFVGAEASLGSDELFAREVVRIVMEGLQPRPAAAREPAS